jgi:outer membrane protein TolC
MNDHPRRHLSLLLCAAIMYPVAASAQTLMQGPPPLPAPVQTPRSAPLAVPPGSFLGGVPTGEPTGAVEKITVISAIQRAIEHNLGVLSAQETVTRAEGAHTRAYANLLPNINGRVGETRQTINLAAFGFGGGGAGSPFGDIPTIVGPFNVFDARVYLQQSVLDFGAINNARAEAHNLEASRLMFRSARDYVIHVAGNLFVQALAASARADAARTQQETARALHQQAIDLKQGGLIAGIDVLRAEVQLSTQTQRTTIAVNEFEKSKLQLARVIGLPLGQQFELDPALPDLPAADMSIENAVALAYKTRPDYQAALDRRRCAAVGPHQRRLRRDRAFAIRCAVHVRGHRCGQRADLPGLPHPWAAARGGRRHPRAPR